MRLVSNPIKVAAVLAVAGLGLSACATRGYVDEQIAAVNSRIDAVDRKASDAMQRADAAAAAAQSAANDARMAGQRYEELNTRIVTMEQQAANRRPRN